MIDQVGFSIEANPIMYYLLTTTGSVWSILVVKIIVSCIMIFTYLKLDINSDEFINRLNVYRVYIVICLMYISICIMNTYIVLLN